MSEILGRSRLHRAALEGQSALVRQLVAEGADADQPDQRGFTPLHFAAQQGHAAEAAFLLQAGADPNVPNDLGNTPLWVAIMAPSNRDVIARDMIAHGADPEIENRHGRTPIEIVRGMGDPELLAILQHDQRARPGSEGSPQQSLTEAQLMSESSVYSELESRLQDRQWRHQRAEFHDWLTTTPGVEGCIEEGLRRAAADEDWLAFELYNLAAFAVPSKTFSPILCDVLRRQVPDLNNEDVVSLLGDIADPIAVDALERALWWHPEWDEFHGLGKKAVDALADIGTEAAWVVIQDAAQTAPAEVRDWALSALRHR